MREAATRAAPLLKRLSEDGASDSAPALAVGPASRAVDSHAQDTSVQAAADSSTEEEQGDRSCVQKKEAKREPENYQPDIAGASQRCVGAASEPAEPPATASQGCASAMEFGLLRPSRGSVQPAAAAAAAAPGVPAAVPHDSRGACDLGVSAHTLRLAEEAEDLRLELAQRMAQAVGLQSRVDHLMACQSEHDSTEASQTAQLAAQSEVSLPDDSGLSFLLMRKLQAGSLQQPRCMCYACRTLGSLTVPAHSSSWVQHHLMTPGEVAGVAKAFPSAERAPGCV